MVIRALSTEVRNSLRTGIIITNASQCVFELVLNSLDAGAKLIAIRVDLIAHKLQVVDNGCGMDRDSLDLVGLRYMTSKCHSLEDLSKPLGQFGFRGEALASLRSVSRLLTIESRRVNSSVTFCKVFKEGKALDTVISSTQRPSRGTTVTVHDFMYNMPVRRHRMRGALNLEEIKGLIEATALTHPQVSFSLRNDVNGSIVLQTYKTSDTLKTFCYLFGQEITRSLIHVTHASDKFQVYGYISNEAHFENNLQFIYLNKRLVNKTKIHKLITTLLLKSSIFRTNRWCETRNVKHKSNGNWLAYSPAPKREKFPVYLINIKCAYTEYDVSFDPKKTLLEFRDWNSVLKCMEEVVVKFLDEKHLGNNENTKINNKRDGSSKASDFNESEDLAQDQALGLVEYVLSDNNESTKESRHYGGTRAIRGHTARRQDEQKTVDSEYNVSNKPSKALLSESSQISDIKFPSESGIEPKTQQLSSQTPLNLWVEDPLTPSPITNPKRVLVDSVSIYKHESTFLSEDPMIESDVDNDSPESTSKKSNDKGRPNSNNEKRAEMENPHISIEKKKDSTFKNIFPVSSFSKSNPEFIGLRDIMTAALFQSLKVLARTQRGKCERGKTVKPNVIQIKEKELTVNRTETIQTKFAKINTEKTNKDDKDLAVRSAQTDEIKSPYFSFLPVIVDHNKVEHKSFKKQLECVRSPYFSKPHLQQVNRLIMQQAAVTPTSNITNLPVVQSPYFRSRTTHSTPNSDVNASKRRNYRQTLNIQQALNFSSTQSNPTNMHMENYILEKTLLPLAVDRDQSISLPEYNNYSSGLHPNEARNCSPKEHIDSQFIDNHEARYSSYQATSSGCVAPQFRNIFRQYDDSRHLSPYSLTLLEPKRNYLTSADFFCTLETVRRNYKMPSNILKIEEYTPKFRVPKVTWGNVLYHSVEKYNHSRDFSDNPDKLSHSSSSSVSSYDPAYFKWQSNQQTMQTPYHVVCDDGQSLSLGSLDRQENCGIEDQKHSSSSQYSDDELTMETEWSLSRKNIILRKNNPENLQSMCDIREKYGRFNSRYNLKCPCTQVTHTSCDYEAVQSLENNKPYLPQFGGNNLRNVIANRSPSTPHQSPPPIKFQQLFSSSTSDDDKHECSKDAAEEYCTMSIKRKQGGLVGDVSKKPRLENSFMNVEKPADSVGGYEISKEIISSVDMSMSTVPKAGPANPCVDDTNSEHSSEEEFLAHILQENPLKCKPQKQQFEETTHSAACVEVPQNKPKYMQDEMNIIVPVPAVHENLVSMTSHESVLNLDKTKHDCLIKNHQERQQTSLAASKSAMESDQLTKYEDMQPDSNKDETTSDKAKWIQYFDADGNRIFVHFRTGMTALEPPSSSIDGDPYSMARRYNFLPKGMSPILKEKDVGAKNVFSPGSLKTVQKAIAEATSANEELSVVKWRDDQPKCEDLIKQLLEDAEKRMIFCESAVPNANIQERSAVGVYNLLTSYTFTNNIFTSLEVLGQLDNKFIVTLVSVESTRSPHLLVLFDQHAVDERIRLENLVEDYLAVGGDTKFKSTPIKPPITVNLTPQELRIVSSFKQEFERIGLKFEESSESSLKVTSVPSCLKAREARETPERHAALLETSVATLVKGHANAIISGGGVGPRIPNILQIVINSEACRGAIKFGDTLSTEACKKMLASLGRCALPFQCAHGRPSLVALADIHQIQMQQHRTKKVDTKPNYLDIKKYLGQL